MHIYYQLTLSSHTTVMLSSCQPATSLLSSTARHSCGWWISISAGVAHASDSHQSTVLLPPASKATAAVLVM